MREENKIISFIKKIIRFFFKEDEEKQRIKSDKLKKEMCKKAMSSGMCSQNCESCAWNVEGE